MAVSLGGAHLFGAFFGVLVSHAAQALALERGELDAVGGVADVQVKDGPDQGQAAGLAGEAADHLGAPLDLAERALEQVRNRYEKAAGAVRAEGPRRGADGSSWAVSTVRPSGTGASGSRRGRAGRRS